MSKERKAFKRTVLFLLLSTLSILIALFFVDTDYKETGSRVAAIVLAAAFYLFLIFGYISFAQISKSRKAQEKKNRSKDKKRKPGIIVFFSNRYAAMADMLMVLSLIVSVVLYAVNRSLLAQNPNFRNVLLEGTCYVFLAAFVFSAQMHAILNGINYQYMIQAEKKFKSAKGKKKSQKAEDNEDTDIADADPV